MQDDQPAFSIVLRRLREAAGYTSAREFFRANGGRVNFGCTYEQYAHVESGRSAPGPRLAERAAVALRVWQSQAKAREYFSAFLRASTKSDRLVELIVAAMSAPAAAESSPLRQAGRRNMDARRKQLSDAQIQAIRRDATTFWSFHVLSCDDRPWAEADLARLLDVAPPKVRKALEFLARHRLLERGRDGMWRNPDPGRIHVYPRQTAYKPDDLPRLLEFYDAREKWGGSTDMYEGLLLRASPRALRNFYPYLAQAVACAGIYAEDDAGDRAMFLVEGRIRRLAELPPRR